jgi:hypothetical protein
MSYLLYNSLTAYHDQPKDLLVFCFPVLVYLFGVGYYG